MESGHNNLSSERTLDKEVRISEADEGAGPQKKRDLINTSLPASPSGIHRKGGRSKRRVPLVSSGQKKKAAGYLDRSGKHTLKGKV